MPVIHLQTDINAPMAVCFDLAKSIDAHIASTSHTHETAIAGKITGLIELGETVTWRARHLGIWQTLTVKITAMEHPVFFADEMVSGAFKFFKHEHYFKGVNTGTQMTDVFVFESPLGFLGVLVNTLFLTRYMTNLLVKRNKVIKALAEGF